MYKTITGFSSLFSLFYYICKQWQNLFNFGEGFSIFGFSLSFSSLVDVDTFLSSSSQVFLLKN